MKTAEEGNEEELYYCGPVNIRHKGFLLATLEKLLKYCPIGSHLVMKSNSRVPDDKPLISIGYKYSSRKFL